MQRTIAVNVVCVYLYYHGQLLGHWSRLLIHSKWLWIMKRNYSYTIIIHLTTWWEQGISWVCIPLKVKESHDCTTILCVCVSYANDVHQRDAHDILELLCVDSVMVTNTRYIILHAHPGTHVCSYGWYILSDAGRGPLAHVNSRPRGS